MFNKYEVIKPLGKGGSATVYLVKHIKLQTLRAIKCIRRDNPYYTQLTNEAHILKNLKHPNIPVIYDIEEDDFFSYIIEEYIEGKSLKAFRLSCNTIHEDMIIKFSIQICELLIFLHSDHRKILYLDLNPQNIIINGTTLKLIDFGTAIHLEEVEKRKFAIGTRGYASPEQYKLKKIDERSDVYSIGMLLFFLLTSITFLPNKNEIVNIDKVDNCSKAMKKIVNKCLKYNPSQRYQTVLQLKNNLLEINTKKELSIYRKSKKSLTISIAGSQHRIGTTHIAFMLTSYINTLHVKCLYQEFNNSHTIKSMTKRFEDIPFIQNIYKFRHCFLLPYYKEQMLCDLEEFQVIIKDFGEINKDNVTGFLDSDYCLLVLGAKDWELDYSEICLHMLEDLKEIYYLFNFIDGKTFQRIMKSMDNQKCYRVPYEANPFTFIVRNEIKELVQELLMGGKNRPSLGERLRHFTRER